VGEAKAVKVACADKANTDTFTVAVVEAYVESAALVAVTVQVEPPAALPADNVLPDTVHAPEVTA
jgi:hypothetical protein